MATEKTVRLCKKNLWFSDLTGRPDVGSNLKRTGSNFLLISGRNVMIDNKQSDFDRDKTGEGQDIEEAVPGWIKYPHLPWQQ